jgi:hypothetical protein
VRELNADLCCNSRPQHSRTARLDGEFRHLHTLGLHLFPVDIDKEPIGQWAHGAINYVETRASLQQGRTWSRDPRTQGWALLCGNRDVAVFTLDVENAGMAYPEILAALASLPATCKRPSPSGGEHAVIVVTEGDPVPTQVLAKAGGVLLAEVRGVSKGTANGAYAVITGPGRGPLPADFAPARLTRRESNALLDSVRAVHLPDKQPIRARLNTQMPGSTRYGVDGLADLDGEGGATPLRPVLEASEAIAAVATAQAGDRNNTLNDEAFQLALWGRMDASTRAALFHAAVSGGQISDDVDVTLDSAIGAATRRRRHGDQWLAALGATTRHEASRHRLGLLTAARHLADLSAAVTQGRPVVMSARELAERLGFVAAETANTYLQELVATGWLTRCEPDEVFGTFRYQLVHPDAHSPKSDNHPEGVTPSSNSWNSWNSVTTEKGCEGDMAWDLDRMLASPWGDGITRHPAFMPGSGPRLSISCMKVLAALTVDAASVREVVTRTGMADTSVRRAMSQLDAAGLIVRGSGATSCALASGNVVGLLDGWAEAHGVTDRVDLMRARHAAHRQQYAEAKRNALGPPGRMRFLRRRKAIDRSGPSSNLNVILPSALDPESAKVRDD